jgi:hypothetical protein
MSKIQVSQNRLAIPAVAHYNRKSAQNAGVAQLIERRLAKAKAEGLSPFTRSKVDLAKPNISKLLRPLLNEN